MMVYFVEQSRSRIWSCICIGLVLVWARDGHPLYPPFALVLPSGSCSFCFYGCYRIYLIGGLGRDGRAENLAFFCLYTFPPPKAFCSHTYGFLFSAASGQHTTLHDAMYQTMYAVRINSSRHVTFLASRITISLSTCHYLDHVQCTYTDHPVMALSTIPSNLILFFFYTLRNQFQPSG